MRDVVFVPLRLRPSATQPAITNPKSEKLIDTIELSPPSQLSIVLHSGDTCKQPPPESRLSSSVVIF